MAPVPADDAARSTPPGLPVGTLDDGAVATVGPGGVVRLDGADWVLEWWVGAEDRWHDPTADAAVRQTLVDDSPVVATAMRVPGGDVVHRAFAARAQAAGWSGTAVVVEVENLTAVPVALALVVRPVDGDGTGLRSVAVDGPAVVVDGRPAVLLSRPAARAVAGDVAGLAGRLADGDDAPPPVEVVGGAAPVGAAAVVPLAHTAVARVLVPVPTPGPRRRRDPVAGLVGPWTAPDAAAVGAGWATHTAGMARLELPEPAAAGFLVRAERQLLLTSTAAAAGLLDRRSARPDAPHGAVDLLDLVDALLRCGLEDPLGPVAAALASSQRLRGAVPVGDGSDATVALVVAAAGVLGGPRAERWLDELVGPLAKAVDRLSRGRGADGVDPARTAAALAAAAAALRHVEQPDVAVLADEVATSLAPGWTGPTTGRVLGALDAAAPATAAMGAVDRARGVVDVLDGLVAWTPDGLRLCDGWAVSWAGQDVEVYDVRTPWGAAGFALRWHETRPALLWEVVPGPGADPERPPTVTVDRIDPAWSGTGWDGEALLAAPKGAATAVPPAGNGDVPGEGESFS